MTGTVAEWTHGRISPERVLGWCAIYWDGAGSANTGPQYYTSIEVPWNFAIYEPDPENLPLTQLQVYLLFWRRHSHMYTEIMSGDDEFWLWGKSQPVQGFLIPDNKWNQLWNLVLSNVYGHRGRFKQDHTLWLNEVPD
jgi:hypothetical protein